MIFITVGTTRFDELIRYVDQAVKNKQIQDGVHAQIGNGDYIPQYFPVFRYYTGLLPYLDSSELVISHAGVGTIFECLRFKTKLIVVANPNVRGKHQGEVARKLDKNGYLLWCKSLDRLLDYIEVARTSTFREYYPPPSHISDYILDVLSKG